MNEEEKKAMFWLKGLEDDKEYLIIEQRQAITTILNLIEKQRKEIEARLEEIDGLYKMMSAKDERIDNLMEMINRYNDMAYIRKIEEKYISKDKIRKLKELVHKTLDDNGITRGYQLTIDNYFKELLGE